MRRTLAVVAVAVMAAACSGGDDSGTDADGATGVEDFVYQLQDYADDGLDELAR